VDQHDRTLWELQIAGHRIYCVMRSCCSGAELQVRRVAVPRGAGAHTEGPSQAERRSGFSCEESVTLVRELYPTKSELYERALALEVEYQLSARG
jgi:hypothetical protein